MNQTETKPRTFSESLDFIYRGFLQMNIDEQKNFLESFSEIVKRTRNKDKQKLLTKFNKLLQKEMMKNFDKWLKSEIKG